MSKNLKYYLLIILPIILVYISNINHDLVHCDDHEIILNSPERIDQLSNIKSEFFRGYIGTSYYRPLINISFIIDRWISPVSNSIFQVSNIIYHIICVLLFFQLLMKFKIKQEWAISIAIIFGILPINVNAVSWIVGRNDLIYTMFGLSSILLLMKQDKIQYLALSAFFTLLAFLSKETALMTSLINIYILFLVLKYTNKSKVIYISLLTLSYTIYFILKSKATLGVDINYMGLDIFLKNLPVIPEFFAKIFLPINLMVLSTYGVLNTSLGIGIVIILTYFITKEKLYTNLNFLTGLVIFACLVGPAMFVTVSNSNDWNEYLECRAYFPTIGILLSLAIALNKYNFSKKIKIIFSIIGLIFTFLSIKESLLYSDRFTFYESLVKDDNKKALFPFMLSRHYRSINNAEKEEEYLLKAYQANDKYYKYAMNLGIYYFKHNSIEASFNYFSKAYKLDSSNEELIVNYSNALLQTGRNKEALELINKFTNKNKASDTKIKMNKILALIKNKDLDKAFKEIDNELLSKQNQEIFTILFYSGEEAYNKKDYIIATQLLEKSIEINNQFIEPYIVLMKINIDIGNLPKARQFSQEIINKGGRIPDSFKEILSE